ncbi:MAG: helix-turn-helix transcriptional regulator [Acidobacteriota bacterium]|nr:helix-turn-helix transcriptional regulator [Acidobacteriota bacterium]
MPRKKCIRHGADYPCTCALGHLYRFIEADLLLLLKQKDGSYGYELLSELEKRSISDAAIDPGALYRTLRTLEANGNVTSEWSTSAGGPARRLYRLTRKGEHHLEEWVEALQHFSNSVRRFVEEARKELR